MKLKTSLAALAFFTFQISKAQDTHMQHMASMFSADKRTPVLVTAMMSQHQLSEMRGHLEAIQEAATALANKDFNAMKTAAKKLASSPETTMVCKHFGKATPGFTEMALTLHKSGDELLRAAEKKNTALFTKQLSVTLKTCTTCHAKFKQEIVPDDVFQKMENKSSDLQKRLLKPEEEKEIASYLEHQ